MSCLDTAKELIDGPRRAEYGAVDESFNNVAKMWSVIAKTDLTPQQVAMMMIAFKLCREANAHKQDNLDDLCGYTALLEQLYNQDPIASFMDSEAARHLA